MARATIQPMVFMELVRLYHSLFLFSLLLITGGSLLLLGKRIGWTLSLASLITNGLFFLIPTTPGKSVLADSTLIWFFISLALVSFILFYILASPGFRNKYNGTRRTWLTVATIVALVLADKFMLFLTS